MEGEAYTSSPLPIFDGEEYELWAARMTSYLEPVDLWEVTKENYDVPKLSANPMVA
uniref:DUF4219 domain-containing protein n=1 Tax=Cajanus cajan TaxID=3821 RepID=A0A151R9A8_CAJCA|nr:hypothetical protein KK1_039640 [Cajanus cajan]